MLTLEIISRYESLKTKSGYSPRNLFNLKDHLLEITKPAIPEPSSPFKKARVQTENSSQTEQARNLREAILINLLLNPAFDSSDTRHEEYDQFFKMLQAPVDQADENLIAQHICALHMSKSKFGIDMFITFLSLCSSIFIEGLDYPNLRVIKTRLQLDVAEFFTFVANSSKITAKIEALVSKISLKSLAHTKDVELKLFSSRISGLHGFSGDGVVYISVNQIYKLYQVCLSHKLSSEDTLTMIHLELFRVFSHQIGHVLLRKSMSDMNESTPELLKLKSQYHLKVEESGILIEIELFGAKINFAKTDELATFEGAYFRQLLGDLINGNRPNLDSSKVVVINPSFYPNMALDLDLPDFFLDI